MNKDVRRIVEEAKRQGWKAETTMKSHVQLFAPDGETIVTIGGTPSDARWLPKTVARMRRAGFEWPPTGRRT